MEDGEIINIKNYCLKKCQEFQKFFDECYQGFFEKFSKLQI